MKNIRRVVRITIITRYTCVNITVTAKSVLARALRAATERARDAITSGVTAFPTVAHAARKNSSPRAVACFANKRIWGIDPPPLKRFFFPFHNVYYDRHQASHSHFPIVKRVTPPHFSLRTLQFPRFQRLPDECLPRFSRPPNFSARSNRATTIATVPRSNARWILNIR